MWVEGKSEWRNLGRFGARFGTSKVSPMLMMSVSGLGFTEVQVPLLHTCKPPTLHWLRMVSKLGSVCAPSPRVREESGHGG